MEYKLVLVLQKEGFKQPAVSQRVYYHRSLDGL